jgi:hypothetical protein
MPEQCTFHYSLYLLVVAAKLGLKTTLLVALFTEILGMLALSFIDSLFDLKASGAERVQATIYITCCQVHTTLD